MSYSIVRTAEKLGKIFHLNGFFWVSNHYLCDLGKAQASVK